MANKKPTKENVNALARIIYASHGYVVDDDKDFSQAHHPQETGAWNLSCRAFEFITGSAPAEIDQRAVIKKKFMERFGS